MGRNGHETMINRAIQLSFGFVSCSFGDLGEALRMVDGSWRQIQKIRQRCVLFDVFEVFENGAEWVETAIKL